MKKMVALLAVVVFAIALGAWLNTRTLAVVLLAQIPRGIAVKMAQGLSAVHGIGAVELDHRNGRYRAAIEHQRSDREPGPIADSSAVAISDLGRRYLGQNTTGSFGTLMGYSVAMGGDVDGLPGDEAVAGGYEFSDHIEERGLVLILSDERAPTRLYGPRQHRAWFGHSVANNGDFDGDGQVDVLVGARFAHNRSGAAYLFPSMHVQSSGDSLLADEPGGAIEFVVDRAEAELGFEVYFGDDWDADGRAELLLRAHIDGVQAGGVYVVYSSKVRTRRVYLDGGEADIQVATGEDYADVGRTICTIGDLDGDGLDELLLGAQAASGFFGSEDHVPSRFYVVLSSDLAQQTDIGRGRMYLVTGAERGEQLGSCAGRLGDVDGDGTPDFCVGARHAREGRGALYVVSGAQFRKTAAKGEEIAVGSLSPLALIGQEGGDLLGWSCAEATDDFDGDGIGDVAVGARGADGRVAGAGAVYIVSGRRVRRAMLSGQRELPVMGDGVLKIGGDRHGARLGSKRRFAAAGDHDGDGLSDLALGTPGWHEGGIYAGAAWIVPGAAVRELVRAADAR